MTTVLPDLWLDWCAVTGADPAVRDQHSLARFQRQAAPARQVLLDLEPDTAHELRGPAWPVALREDPTSLHRVLKTGTAILRADVGWAQRLLTHRLLFAAVLLAPTRHGGLGLDRASVRALTPRTLQRRRSNVGTTIEPGECPACALSSWLEILGTSSTWSRSSVRALLVKAPDEARGEHRHERPDPEPGWADWLDHANLLPAVDRWGWMGRYTSMHRSSVSQLTAAITRLAAQDPPPASPTTRPLPMKMSARSMSDEQVDQIFTHADELNARLALILAEFGQ